MASIHRAMHDAQTTLDFAYTPGDGSMHVADAAALSPSSAYPYVIRARASGGGPAVLYEVTNVVAGNLGVTRVEGAADQSWPVGTLIENVVSAYAWERLRSEYIAHTHSSTGSAGLMYRKGTKTWDPVNLPESSQTSTTLTVTGATVGQPVAVGFSQSLNGLQLTGYVSAADTVTALLANPTGTGSAINLGQGTLTAIVWAV